MSPRFTDLPTIRPLADEDALDVIELIAGVFGEYRGCVTDVDGEMPELRRLASHYAEHGGQGWAAVRGERVVGTAGVTLVVDPAGGPPLAELKKLYVHRTERGTGLAGALLERVEAAARSGGAGRIFLWSDTRFTRAHRFYEKNGYVRGPTTRDLHDASHTTEYFFEKDLPR
jgi:putative acetyltransferase